MARSLGSLACNMAATALLAPLFALSALSLAVQGVASLMVFKILWWVIEVLSIDPDWGAPALVGVVGAAMCALFVGCFLLPWLFPALLLVLGGMAETWIVLGLRLTGEGEAWVPALGSEGIAISGLQLWRVAMLREHAT